MSEITYKPIGTLYSSNKNPIEAPRQAVLAETSEAYIELTPHIVADCFSDLEGFSRIWIIYDFHQAKTWKPKVRPPRASDKKRSVLATRSPYRPNSIGMSCVRLQKIENNKIYISEHDLLDQTPILDIKPYLSYADSFPDESKGWLEEAKKFEVLFSEESQKELTMLDKRLDYNMTQIITSQLEYQPTNSKIKRVKKTDENEYVFSVKTWRVSFKTSEDKIHISNVHSGYNPKEMHQKSDKYNDKHIHLEFIKTFK